MKEEILDILKNADGYISGERISEMLNVSRTAIWKHIKSLRESGYKIESVTNKGYRLISSPDIITESGIKSGLTTDFIGHNLFIYDETDTTNNRAKESNSSPDGSVFIAEVQTHGKGSRGRGWTSPRGIGIWHSILLKPEISPLEVSQITLVAGLAVCKAIGLNSMIKWPNDIVINGKKICGILIKNSFEGENVKKSITGIGVNVNNDIPKDLADIAINLKSVVGEVDIDEFYKRLIENLYADYSVDEYRSRNIVLGKEITVIKNGESRKSVAEDVAADGSLVLKGGERLFYGEVTIRF